MSTALHDIINLDDERHYRAYCKAIGFDPNAPERPVDPEAELSTTSRAWLAVDDALNPWSDSVLISMLATATPIERGEIIRELERNRP